jgi:hypothetical protein
MDTERQMFTKGATVEITRKAHAYTHMGYTDPGHIIPEEVEVMTVKSARQTKNGLKVHFRRDDNTGYAIDIDRATLFTFKAV